MDHKAIIEGLGGPKVVASALGVRENAVCHWKARGIPPFYWPDIEKLARDQGGSLSLSAETLRASRRMKVHRSGEAA